MTMLLALLFGGVSLAGPPPPVVGGEPVEAGAWPATAAVWFGGEPSCTGVLVAPDLVLSAGHCGRPATHVSFGNDDLWGAERIRIADTWVHERHLVTLDLAAFRLERPVEGIVPAPLTADGLEDGVPVHIVGWGATDEDARRYPDVLMAAEAAVWDADCSEPGWGCMPQVQPGGELVAGGPGVDSCSGDSGGPLYRGTGVDAVVVGVTSRGIDSDGPECGDGGIYVRADAAAAWIETLSLDAVDSGTPGDADRRDGLVNGAFTGGACRVGPLPGGVAPLLAPLILLLVRRRGG